MTDLNLGTIYGTNKTILGGTLSPTQLTAHVNDYDPGACRFMLLTSDGSYNITGLVAGADGQEVLVVNTSNVTLTLVNQSSSSVDANRFVFNTGANVALTQNQGVRLFYDATAARWRGFA
jgi:hypothetical protein